jgi:hypothetical protein
LNFRIEIFAKVRNSQKGEFGIYCPELVLLTVPNFREYFYTKIQFSTPGSKFRCINLGSKSSGWPNIPVLIASQFNKTKEGPFRPPSVGLLFIEYMVVTIQNPII